MNQKFASPIGWPFIVALVAAMAACLTVALVSPIGVIGAVGVALFGLLSLMDRSIKTWGGEPPALTVRISVPRFWQAARNRPLA